MMNVVKELMGHSNIQTTMEYYSQVDADHEAKAARVIQNLLDVSDEQSNPIETDAGFTPGPILGQNEGVAS